MKRTLKISICIFFLLNFAGQIFAQTDSPYIRYWVVCGPFENADLSTECIKNEGMRPLKSGEIVGGKKCRRYLSCEAKIIFGLDELFGHYDNAVAYAFTEIYSSTSRKVRLFLGSDDGIKVWLNGKNVFTNDAVRGLIFDEDKIDIKLTPGWNSLLIKISNVESEWGFSARFVRRGSDDVSDLIYRPSMMYQLPVKKVRVSSTQEPDLEGKVDFKAENAIDKKRHTRWSSEWSEPQWIALDLGRTRPVKKILLNWEAYAKNYSIELSNNKIMWSSIYSTDLGDGGQDVINLKEPTGARYIKVKCFQRAARYGFSLREIQVFSQKVD